MSNNNNKERKTKKELEIIDLIKKIQEENDQKAKQILLEKYYVQGCLWAKKILSNIVYTDLISPTTDEISSLVYQAFEKSIKNLSLEKNKKLSFKNFFFLMIKYQIFSELKTTLNYRIVHNYSEESKNILRELNEAHKKEKELIHIEHNKHQLEKIKEFLNSKNKLYWKIIQLKMEGYKNEEICKITRLNQMSLKSRLQYIRKLIVEHLGLSF